MRDWSPYPLESIDQLFQLAIFSATVREQTLNTYGAHDNGTALDSPRRMPSQSTTPPSPSPAAARRHCCDKIGFADPASAAQRKAAVQSGGETDCPTVLLPARAQQQPGEAPWPESWRCTAQENSGALQTAPTATANGCPQPGLIFARGDEDAWDAGGVSNPVVHCFMGDDEQRWLMWYDGLDAASASCDAPRPSCIGLAVSSDGVRWLRGGGDVAGRQGPEQLRDVGRVLGPNADWWWHDTRAASVSDVQIFSSEAVNTGVGVYWMFYSGADFEARAAPAGMPGLAAGEEVEGIRSRVGLAMSQDGRNWARIEAGHHTGALFDTGAEGEWDEALNGRPQVLALGPGDMRMYYHAFDARRQRWTVGLATSRDGFNWSKQGPIFDGGPDTGGFDGRGAASHCIVRDADSRRYVMFYEAVAADEGRSISVAVSRDGVSGWRRLGRPALSAGAAGCWDAAGVGCPCAVPMAGGKWRLYYSGRRSADGPWEGIGLALTDADSTDEFEGVRIGYRRRTPRQ